jgi:hypothetical protein
MLIKLVVVSLRNVTWLMVTFDSCILSFLCISFLLPLFRKRLSHRLRWVEAIGRSTEGIVTLVTELLTACLNNFSCSQQCQGLELLRLAERWRVC